MGGTPEVDADNFEEAFLELERHLPRAAFVAMDLEMTGIMGPPETKVSSGDVPQVQYSKGRAVVDRPYAIVQVGICLFEEKAPGQFDCRPFNVFVFPRPFDERDADGRQVKVDDYFLGLSASSVTFLARNGLDFTRWVSKGVSYTSAAMEDVLLGALPLENGPTGGSAAAPGGDGRDRPEPSRPGDVAMVNETMKKVAEFAASGEQEMKLPWTNTFLALVLRQRIAETHPSFVVEKRPNAANPNSQDRWVVNLSDEARKQRDLALRRRFMAHIGFRRMWNLLKEKRRPMILHNGFFDLLFMSSAFEGPLPHALMEFKSFIHSAFPVVFDTKVLAEAAELSGILGTCRSSLSELAAGLADRLRRTQGCADATPGSSPMADATNLGAANANATGASGAGCVAGSGGGSNGGAADEQVADKVVVTFAMPAGFDKYANSQVGEGDAKATPDSNFHTAGYDAFQTGCIFAYYRAKLGDEKTLEFANRVYLMFSAFELSFAGVWDRLLYDGVARYLYDVDTGALNNRGLSELLKPVTEEGKRKIALRWCNDNRSILLIVHGHGDAPMDAASRQACERVLDGLLRAQEEQGRLKFRTLEAHLEDVCTAAVGRGAGRGLGSAAGDEDAAPAKRRRGR